MVTFYVVRHGETLLNFLDRAQGWSDSPLTPRGIKAAAELGTLLRGVVFDAACASDTIRATRTGEEILRASGNGNIPIRQDPRLREWCLGTMEAENNALFQQEVSRWLGGVTSFAELNRRLSDVAEVIYSHDTTGMAEPFAAITGRLGEMIEDTICSFPTEGRANVLLVTHAFLIKTMAYLYVPEKLEMMAKLKNASVFRLIYNNGSFTLESGPAQVEKTGAGCHE